MDKNLRRLLNDAFKLAASIVHNSADAHDVIQDSAAIALSHRSAPTPSSEEFRPWFYKVVRNKSIDRARANQVKVKRQNDDASAQIEETSSDVDGPESKALAINRQQMITEALDSISVKQREIVMLKDFHDFSYAEIADILDIAKGSVMSRLHRARLALKEAIDELENK